MTGADYRGQKRMPATEMKASVAGQASAHHPMTIRVMRGFVLLFGVLLLWGLLSFAVSSVPLKNLQVEGLTRYGEEEILVASGLATAKKFSEVDREAAVQTLVTRYPYISSVRIRYAFPLGYRVYVEEEAPVYYTRIADDYFAISRELKVLERATSPRRFKAQGLQQITLGGVKSVMLGQTLRYDGEYLDRVLQDIGNSVLADCVTDVYIGDRYHLSVECDEKYTLFLGDIESIEAKLQLASLMMQQSDVPTGYRAVLDVSDLKKTSIRLIGLQDAALSVSE